MKTIILLFGSFVTLLSFSISASSQVLPHEMLQGSWMSQNSIYGNNSAIWSSFNFQRTQMTVSARCVYPDNSRLRVSAKVAVMYAGNEIYLRTSAADRKQDGIRYCQVSLGPTRWQFYMNGLNRATLLAPVPYGTQFNLVRY